MSIGEKKTCYIIDLLLSSLISTVVCRAPDRCKHFRIVVTDEQKFQVPGWPIVHATMADVISYHMKVSEMPKIPLACNMYSM